jgi:N-succinyldiaminopimelate aminotransferase
MNPDLNRLQPYPFQRLAQLKHALGTPQDRVHIALSIGEPKHRTPDFIGEALLTHLHGLANYPATAGHPELRHQIAAWAVRRFNLPRGSLNPERHVLPVNGTREALFAIAQCIIDRTRKPLIIMPNPFYQIYEGAALLAGGEPYYVNCERSQQYRPVFDSIPPSVWRQCQLLYLCTPANPTGAVLSESDLQVLLKRAEEYDFVLASDECYSEIYLDETAPPPGLLGAAARMGNTDYERCVVFNSLSKRSNAPGLRSGFVAGDATLIDRFLKYRTYHGCTMAPPIQAASAKAWQDETHVVENRRLYRVKFDAIVPQLSSVLAVTQPSGGFFLWPELPIDDEQFARELYTEQNVTVLPGSYLSREAGGSNPGRNHVRMALVAPLEECIEATQRIREFIVGNSFLQS